jgi:A/G-specific adenine glycosylase
MNVPYPHSVAIGVSIHEWYCEKARVLPWRVGPADIRAGRRPDPYLVWLSEILLQQTTTVHAQPYFMRFAERWPTVQRLSMASWDELSGAWSGLGYYSRARNLLASAKILAARPALPTTYDEWLRLPGVGPYTASAICAIAYGERRAPMDGNLHRVISRIYAIDATPTRTGVDTARKAAAVAADQLFLALPETIHAGDLAQGLMDLGATVCTPRAPRCDECPVRASCSARRGGVAERYPVRIPRKAAPSRFGRCFVAIDAHGRVLATRRPATGLLAAMRMPPGDEWGNAPAPVSSEGAPCVGEWRRIGAVRHVFTHFTLELDVWAARTAGTAAPSGMEWVDPTAAAGFPTCGLKAIRLAQQLAPSP